MNKLKHALGLSVVKSIGKNAMEQACSSCCQSQQLTLKPPGLF